MEEGGQAAPASVDAEKQEKALAALAALDEPLFAVLGSGDIRLLCAAWLLTQPKGWRLERRQDLEAREAAGERPFLTAKQAEAALRKGKRAIAVVSQCAALPQPHFQPRPPASPPPRSHAATHVAWGLRAAAGSSRAPPIRSAPASPSSSPSSPTTPRSRDASSTTPDCLRSRAPPPRMR